MVWPAVTRAVVCPLLCWIWAVCQARGWLAAVTPPPALDAQVLWVMITGMLGIAGMRSFDKLKGTATRAISRAAVTDGPRFRASRSSRPGRAAAPKTSFAGSALEHFAS